MNQTTDKIISSLSQWKVIIPLAVIVFIWFVWPQKKIQPQVVEKKQDATQSEVSLSSIFGNKKKLQCNIQEASATIDDTKVAATMNSSKGKEQIIFNGDCLYRWNSAEKIGQKTCGLKSYLPFVSQLGSTAAIEKIFPQFRQLAGACKPIATIDISRFSLPKNIKFEEVALKF